MLQGALPNEVLHIDPLEEVRGARLQVYRARVCEHGAAVLQDADLDEEVAGRSGIGGEVEVDAVAVGAEQSVVAGEELVLLAGEVVGEAGRGGRTGGPAERDDAAQAVLQVGQGAALVALNRAKVDDDARNVRRVGLQLRAVGLHDLQERLQQLLDLSGNLAHAGFLGR